MTYCGGLNLPKVTVRGPRSSLGDPSASRRPVFSSASIAKRSKLSLLFLSITLRAVETFGTYLMVVLVVTPCWGNLKSSATGYSHSIPLFIIPISVSIPCQTLRLSSDRRQMTFSASLRKLKKLFISYNFP